MIIQLRDIEFSISEFKEYKNVNLAKFMFMYLVILHIILFQHILLTT